MHRVIDERPLSATEIDETTARALYRDMVRTRRFDERAIPLQRRGWMSGYPPFEGQEASQIGAAHAMGEPTGSSPPIDRTPPRSPAGCP